jgi:hypothetical protein
MSSLSFELLPELWTAADSLRPSSLAGISDDQCFELLAGAVERRDAVELDQVAQLIGRLAVAIE